MTLSTTSSRARRVVARHNTLVAVTLGLLVAALTAGVFTHHNSPATAHPATVLTSKVQTSGVPCPSGMCPVDEYPTTVSVGTQQADVILRERPAVGQQVTVYTISGHRYSAINPASGDAALDLALGSLAAGVIAMLVAGSVIGRWA